MAASIQALDTGVVPRIKDAAGVLSQADRHLHILSAVREYQKARPRKLVKVLTGNDAYDYAVSLLPSFVDGFSAIKDVRGAIVSGYPPPSLDRDEWVLERTEAGAVLRLVNALFPSSQTFEVHYTAPHTVTDATCTVWVSDDEAVMDLAAAYCCSALAAYYGQETDGSIGADTVDRAGKPEQYRSMETAFRKGYEAKLLPPPPPKPFDAVLRA